MSFDLIFFPLTSNSTILAKVLQQRHPIIISKFVTMPKKKKKSNLSCTRLYIYIHVITIKLIYVTHIQRELCIHNGECITQMHIRGIPSVEKNSSMINDHINYSSKTLMRFF